MRIYTRHGDSGQTDLIGGPRVGKDHPRVRAFGGVDELNACLGLAIADCHQDAIETPLITVQHRLFDIGAQLAAPGSAQPVAGEPDPATGLLAGIRAMEAEMDRATAQLPPLTAFILPGGCELSARLHLARTVCRRAEREVVALSEADPVEPAITAYLNRLSDLLFVLARLANHLAGEPDVMWRAGRTPPKNTPANGPQA